MKSKDYYTDIRKRNREFINSIKEHNKCSICGDGRVYVLDLHHLDSDKKEFTVSRAGGNTYSLEYLKREIEKCCCLCANCHREVHFLNTPEINDKLLPVEIPELSNTQLKNYKEKNIGNCGFIGVSFKHGKRKKKYTVSMNRKGFRTFKYFLTPEEAAIYYDDLIIELDGVDATTNRKIGLLED